jgi:hypothetical protein
MARRLARLEQLPVDERGRVEGLDLAELEHRIAGPPPLAKRALIIRTPLVRVQAGPLH